MLYVHGSAEAARHRYQAEQRADWAQALPVVLEKHGYLEFEARSADAVSGSDIERHGCVIVGPLPARSWTPEFIATIADAGQPVLLDGPLPAELHRRLGIRSAVPAGVWDVTLLVTDPALRDRGAALGAAPGGRMARPGLRPVQRMPGVEWSALEVPVDAHQATAWRAPAWDVARWDVEPDVSVLAEWHDGEATSRAPAVVRKGSLTACAVGLLSYLSQAHTAPPVPRGGHLTSPRSFPLETLLLGLVDGMHLEAGRTRARVLPWPHGKTWALNVRHDFDRFLEPADVARVMSRHASAGTSSTWYWRARHLDAKPLRPRTLIKRRAAVRALRVVAEARGHEVALHTEQLWNGAEREQKRIEAAIGRAVHGTSAHGDPTCFRFQGAPNVLWAVERGLRYTELIQHGHFHPHRFPALAADGSVSALDIVCLPHHESFDLSMEEGDTGADRITRMVDVFRRVGGFMQILNHPDLNTGSLFDLLRAMPGHDRWDCTAVEAADWWARTHHREALSVEVSGGRARFWSGETVHGLGVELLDGEGIQRHLIDVGPDAPTEITLPVGEMADSGP